LSAAAGKCPPAGELRLVIHVQPFALKLADAPIIDGKARIMANSLVTCRARRLLPGFVALWLAAAPAAIAQSGYKIQRIAKIGDPLGSVFVFKAGGFGVSALNSSGHILFVAENEAGGQMLLRFAEGRFTPLVVGDGDAPGGKWPKTVRVLGSASLNASGNATFAADVAIGGKTSTGTFYWLAAIERLVAIAGRGQATVNGLMFEQGGGAGPVITRGDDIAFVAQVKNSAGKAQEGVFLYSPNGTVQGVALPDQPLAGGRKLTDASAPSANDAGLVAFLGRRQGDSADSAYLWEQGAITPIVEAGADLPNGGKLTGVLAVRMNNLNRNALVLARTRAGDGLYFFTEGRLVPVAVPGQELEGGGKLKTIQEGGVSSGNDLGQYAFLAVLEDKSTAAYLLNADGKITRVLKEGDSPTGGKIPNVGQGAGTSRGIALNSKGEVALILREGSGSGGAGGGGGGGGGGSGDHGGGGGGGADYLVLLTPNP
jgi:hypothetical protein